MRTMLSNKRHTVSAHPFSAAAANEPTDELASSSTLRFRAWSARFFATAEATAGERELRRTARVVHATPGSSRAPHLRQIACSAHAMIDHSVS